MRLMNDFVGNLVRRGAGLFPVENSGSPVLPDGRVEGEALWAGATGDMSVSHEGSTFSESDQPWENPSGVAHKEDTSSSLRVTPVRQAGEKDSSGGLHPEKKGGAPQQSPLRQAPIRDKAESSSGEVTGQAGHRSVALPARGNSGVEGHPERTRIRSDRVHGLPGDALLPPKEETGLARFEAKSEAPEEASGGSSSPRVSVIGEVKPEGNDFRVSRGEGAVQAFEAFRAATFESSAQRPRPSTGAPGDGRGANRIVKTEGDVPVSGEASPRTPVAPEDILPEKAGASLFEARDVRAQPGRAVVQVHIGRIEVRAAPRPAPPSRGSVSSKARSGLSLEEYLRRRNEGRR